MSWAYNFDACDQAGPGAIAAPGMAGLSVTTGLLSFNPTRSRGFGADDMTPDWGRALDCQRQFPECPSTAAEYLVTKDLFPAREKAAALRPAGPAGPAGLVAQGGG